MTEDKLTMIEDLRVGEIMKFNNMDMKSQM